MSIPHKQIEIYHLCRCVDEMTTQTAELTLGREAVSGGEFSVGNFHYILTLRTFDVETLKFGADRRIKSVRGFSYWGAVQGGGAAPVQVVCEPNGASYLRIEDDDGAFLYNAPTSFRVNLSKLTVDTNCARSYPTGEFIFNYDRIDGDLIRYRWTAETGEYKIPAPTSPHAPLVVFANDENAGARLVASSSPCLAGGTASGVFSVSRSQVESRTSVLFIDDYPTGLVREKLFTEPSYAAGCLHDDFFNAAMLTGGVYSCVPYFPPSLAPEDCVVNVPGSVYSQNWFPKYLLATKTYSSGESIQRVLTYRNETGTVSGVDYRSHAVDDDKTRFLNVETLPGVATSFEHREVDLLQFWDIFCVFYGRLRVASVGGPQERFSISGFWYDSSFIHPSQDNSAMINAYKTTTYEANLYNDRSMFDAPYQNGAYDFPNGESTHRYIGSPGFTHTYRAVGARTINVRSSDGLTLFSRTVPEKIVFTAKNQELGTDVGLYFKYNYVFEATLRNSLEYNYLDAQTNQYGDPYWFYYFGPKDLT